MARTACQLTSSGTVVTPITFFFQTPFCSFFANKNIGHCALVQDGRNVNKGRHFFVSSDFSLGDETNCMCTYDFHSLIHDVKRCKHGQHLAQQ